MRNAAQNLPVSVTYQRDNLVPDLYKVTVSQTTPFWNGVLKLSEDDAKVLRNRLNAVLSQIEKDRTKGDSS